jgi:hypothetical protein
MIDLEDVELLRKHAKVVKNALAEARVKSYTRRSKTGKQVVVKDFQRQDRQRKPGVDYNPGWGGANSQKEFKQGIKNISKRGATNREQRLYDKQYGKPQQVPAKQLPADFMTNPRRTELGGLTRKKKKKKRGKGSVAYEFRRSEARKAVANRVYGKSGFALVGKSKK